MSGKAGRGEWEHRLATDANGFMACVECEQRHPSSPECPVRRAAWRSYCAAALPVHLSVDGARGTPYEMDRSCPYTRAALSADYAMDQEEYDEDDEDGKPIAGTPNDDAEGGGA